MDKKKYIFIVRGEAKRVIINDSILRILLYLDKINAFDTDIFDFYEEVEVSDEIIDFTKGYYNNLEKGE